MTSVFRLFIKSHDYSNLHHRRLPLAQRPAQRTRRPKPRDLRTLRQTNRAKRLATRPAVTARRRMIVTDEDAKTLGLAVVLSAIVIVCLWIGFDR